MRYRRFGSLDWQVSVLGLSLGGLPLEEVEPGRTGRADRDSGATEAYSIRLIRHAIDHGVNYLDLGFPYDLGHQKRVAAVAGRALQGGYRERVKISVTVPVSTAESTDDFDYYLDAQMEWLQTDSVDCCVLSSVNRDSWPRIRELGFIKKAERVISAGRVGSLGFVFHDHFQILRQVLEEYDKWVFSQFEFSYMDAGHDPGAPGLAYAADRGIAVVVTDPLKGGRLTKTPPEPVERILEAAPHQRSLADWALSYVWNHPAVCTAVCGLTSMDQLIGHLALADKAEAGTLTVRDELTINKVRDAYEELRTIDCASCRPCMPCPQGIDVPRIFEIYNDAVMYGDLKTASSVYRREGHRADECTECGACESKCCRREPLPIAALLKTAYDLLGAGVTIR